MDEKRMTREQVAEKARVDRLRPTEADFQAINPAGHKRTYRPDGSYTWENNWKTNHGGKKTRVQHEVEARYSSFTEADNARWSKIQKATPRVAMKDSGGAVHFVEPGRADDAARRNGWGHSWRVARVIKKAGPDGMLWSLIKDEWYPTGRWCAGDPHEWSVRPQRGNADGTMMLGHLYTDPDGNRWRFVAEEWRRL
jgi:hypothetical protein